MPPEQALGNWDTVDGRTDLWAVGATMYTLLTGRIVHEAENVNKLLLAAMTKRPRAIRSVDAAVPPGVAAVVDRALVFEQKDRWPDATAMRAAVRQARAPGCSPEHRHALAARQPRRPGHGGGPAPSPPRTGAGAGRASGDLARAHLLDVGVRGRAAARWASSPAWCSG